MEDGSEGCDYCGDRYGHFSWCPESVISGLREQIEELHCTVTGQKDEIDTLRQLALGEPEPGQPIWEGDCPVCGTHLDVHHGEDEGQVGIIYQDSPNRATKAERKAYVFSVWLRNSIRAGRALKQELKDYQDRCETMKMQLCSCEKAARGEGPEVLTHHRVWSRAYGVIMRLREAFNADRLG